MRVHAFAAACIVAFAAGCATKPVTAGTAGKCTSSQCRIAVGSADCKIDPNPDPFTISKTKNVKLTWELTTSGAKWPAQGGIVFTNPGTDFTDCSRKNDTTWECTDKNVTAGTFKYKITVENCAPLDPEIINEP